MKAHYITEEITLHTDSNGQTVAHSRTFNDDTDNLAMLRIAADTMEEITLSTLESPKGEEYHKLVVHSRERRNGSYTSLLTKDKYYKLFP